MAKNEAVTNEPVGRIFNIQAFSTKDGPGVRTVVFFQGCNMRCLWCHNPESQAIDPPEAFIVEKCIGCKNCEAQKTKPCYAGARVTTMQQFSVKGLWDLLKTEFPYWGKGGGLTFSGGECMLQADFLAAIIKLCRQHKVHTAVDTAGNVAYKQLQMINPHMFLYDIKANSPEDYKKLTGVDGVLVWQNLERLIKDGFTVQVRVPCVPGGNWEQLESLSARLKSIGVTNVDLLPYHQLGEGKAQRFGLRQPAQNFTVPSEKGMDDLWKMFNFQKL